MATSGTYVTEVPLKGTVEKHYKKWRSENHAISEAIGHHVQNVTIHEGKKVLLHYHDVDTFVCNIFRPLIFSLQKTIGWGV
ncbi:hypothetical protein F2Q70_00037550 [Brassica cretica]|uniref:Bet v I/Major latex protein domain-containing protein n=1 Tax=Brassica cretica TaxID=69181 RepID=A0A8S9JT41_BRACR|nr:hypothetical protein F2Q70_00037550 [Brassica cretica]